jgi:hypothetical protein
MKPVKMTIKLTRDTGNVDTGEGEVFDMVIVGNYYPGEDGYRSGHPDGWTEDVGHDFEVTSSVSPAGDCELTEEEWLKVLDLACARFNRR